MTQAAARTPKALALAALLLFAVSAPGALAEQQRSVAGVQKVIQMLTDMSAKAKQEKKDEEVAFGTFTTWCSQESSSLTGEIAKNGEEIELLDASIAHLTSDVEALGAAIEALKGEVTSSEAEKKAEAAQREKDHASFMTESQDYSESIDALDRALLAMQKEDYDRSAATALLQLSEEDRVPAKVKSIAAAFVGMMGSAPEEGYGSYEAPQANAYEFQSGGIVDLLKKLKDEFRSKLGECQKEEMNSKHASDMKVQDLTDAVENAEKDIEEKTAEKERKAAKAGLEKKQLASTTAVKADNEQTLKSVTTECTEKKLSFAEKQKLRTEEIEAIAKATEILSSPEVLGSAEKHLSLAQSRSSTALLQTLDLGRASGFRHKLRDFLEHEGRRLHSERLGLLAEKIAADPFAKVKKLIDAMITRLLEEANEDANHEGFCDEEFGKNKVTRNKLSETIDALSAAVEDGKATSLQLAQEIAALEKEIAELDKARGEATAMRKEEKAKNAETVKDAKAAQAAVLAATAVLKDYYAKASTATAFLQATPAPREWGLKLPVKMGSEEWNSLANPDLEGTVDTGHKEGMQTFGEGYKGQQEESEYGVLALLEVVQADFATLEADTSTAEAESQRTYEQFMTQSQKSKATKAKKVEMNGADKASAEAKLRADIADLKATQDQLLAADRYYEKLVPQCIDKGMTFEERVKAREAEIASLREALSILSSEDIATSAF